MTMFSVAISVVRVVALLVASCTLIVLVSGKTNNNNNCSVCADGVSQPPNPDQTLSSGTGTCGTLDSIAFSMEDASEDCYLRQLTAYHECGCPMMPRTPEGSCNLCINPDDTPDLDAFTDSYNSRPRCLDLAKNAFYLLEEDDTRLCREMQWNGYQLCGCTLEPTLPAASSGYYCTLCPDGSPLPNPDKTVRQGGTETCAQSAKHLAFSLVFPDECPDAWEVGGLLCDCPPATAVCPVCRGDSLLNPNATIQLEEKTTGETMTCESLFQQGEQGLLEASRCRFYQYLARETCCEAKVTCQLCEDGSPVPELLESVSTTGCARYELLIEDVRPKALCTAIQANVGHLCGCSNPNAISSDFIVCDICEADEIFNEEAPTRVTLTGEEHSCIGAVLGSSARVVRGDLTCNDVKLRYSNDCCQR